MEGDKHPQLLVLLDLNFYPRPHMEGDFGHRLFFVDNHNFYPRPHMEGDGSLTNYAGMGGTGFLPTPSHGGRPLTGTVKQIAWAISTHALTWRATCG